MMYSCSTTLLTNEEKEIAVKLNSINSGIEWDSRTGKPIQSDSNHWLGKGLQGASGDDSVTLFPMGGDCRLYTHVQFKFYTSAVRTLWKVHLKVKQTKSPNSYSLWHSTCSKKSTQEGLSSAPVSLGTCPLWGILEWEDWPATAILGTWYLFQE